MRELPIVLLLAGGKSERFWPLGDKNLLEFLGKTLIEQQIERIKNFGYTKIVAVCNPQNIDKIKNLGVTTVLQRGSGQQAAILSAEQIIKTGSILIVNANDFLEGELFTDLRKASFDEDVDGLLCAKVIETYFPGGYLVTNNDNRLLRIVEKPEEGKQPSSLVNVGVDYYKEAKLVFKFLREAGSTGDDLFERGIQRMIDNDVKIKVVNYRNFWGFLKYPWHVLDIMNYFLKGMNQKRTIKNAVISKNAVIIGPVFIEDGVKILENAKIVGPCYIGKNCIIGNNVMLRESMVGRDSVLGFGSDITRSYIGRDCWFHSNYVGDSILSCDISFGAGTNLANFRLDEGEINSKVKGVEIKTGRTKLGSIIGKGVRVGINTSIMPGVKIGNNCLVGGGINIADDIADGTFCYGKTDLVIKKNNIRVDIKKRAEFKKIL